MVEKLEALSDILKTFPSYMGEGIMELLVMVIGGLFLGYLTSKYLYKINELNRVEGWILEKRIPIYEGLFKRTEEMMQLYMVSPDEYRLVAQLMEKLGLQLNESARQVSKLFIDSEEMATSFLEFDRYASQHRLFFDNQVAQEVNVLQNYYAFLRRMLVLFEEQMIIYGVDKEEPVRSVRRHLLIALGMYLSAEFLQQVEIVQNTIRVNINHLEISHREKPDYSYDYYESETGFMMVRLKDLRVMKDREAIKNVIFEFVAMGLIAGGVRTKDMEK